MVVRKVSLWNYTEIAAMFLKLFFAFYCFVRIQVHLFIDENVAGCVINKECAAVVLVFYIFFPICRGKSTASGANEVINRDLLAGV